MQHVKKHAVTFIGLGNHTAAPLLYGYLSMHPEVHCVTSTVQFFSDATQFAMHRDTYERQFLQSKKESARAFGDCATTYLAHAQAAGMIARTYPSARLIAVIDNPRTVLKVDYLEALRTKQIMKNTTFSEYLTRHPEVLLRAKYGQQLVHYFSYYSPADFLVVVADDLRNDPLRVFAQVCAHLEVGAKFVPPPLLHLVVEEEEDPKKKKGLIRRFFGLPGKAITYLRRLWGRYKRYPIPSTEVAYRYIDRITIDESLGQKIDSYFAEDMVTLSSLLHRDMSVEWQFPLPQATKKQ